jgi:aminoglycoside/choline kinase family phosphotransferase
MNQEEVFKILVKEYEQHFNISVESATWVSGRATAKILVRVNGSKGRAISCFNSINPKETDTLVYLSDFFLKKNLSVPKILGRGKDPRVFFMEDFGDSTLLDVVLANFNKNAKIKALYENALTELIKFQTLGAEVDFSKCWPYQAFTDESILFDIGRFCSEFINVYTHQINTENYDIILLVQHAKRADFSYFMYRDFQARNIMVRAGDSLGFIDFQGGRQGPKLYDVASLLFQSSARVTSELRKELVRFYLNLSQTHGVYQQGDEELYYVFCILRLMQVIGHYATVLPKKDVLQKDAVNRQIVDALDSLLYCIDTVELFLPLNSKSDAGIKNSVISAKNNFLQTL